MRLACVLLAALLATAAGAPCAGAETSAPDGESDQAATAFGPFPLESQHPLTAPFYQPLPDSTRTVPRGAFAFELLSQYGSSQKGEIKGASSAVFDSEFHRLSFGVRYGALERLEARIAVPIQLRGAGFLDNTIKEFHNATGLLRDDRPSHEFVEELVIDGETVIDNDSQGYRLGDTAVQLKLRVLDEGSLLPAVAVRGAIELPTGDEDEWLGNDGVDGGFGLLAEKSSGSFSIYLNFDARFLSRPRRLRQAGIGLRPAFASMGAVEWRVARSVALMAQVNSSTRIFEHGRDLITLENVQVQLFAGLHVRLSERLKGFVGLNEDLVRASSPDVIVFFGLRYDLFDR